ncbi:MAG: hypothetical protein JNK57_14860 [Planctomycetaceae bacterium]|nr:hypothetical protein [Planctomycetaceae bacterium]
MECREFEDFINELLDRRLPMELDELASEHQLACEDCRSRYIFFSNLDRVVGSRMDAAANGSWKSSEDRLVADLIQNCLHGEKDAEHASGIPVAMVAPMVPVAMMVRPGGQRKRMWNHPILISGLALGTCLVLSIGTSWFWSGNDSNVQTSDANILAKSADSQVGGVKSADGHETQIAVSELQELTKNWDESVVAFDRGWQNMAVGRVRAHQLPGIQPAVYPITGAVEAFRKNVIVRNPNGLAAGVRW